MYNVQILKSVVKAPFHDLTYPNALYRDIIILMDLYFAKRCHNGEAPILSYRDERHFQKKVAFFL